MLKESFPEIGSNTYVNKIFIFTLKDINVKKFHKVSLRRTRTVHLDAHHSLLYKNHPLSIRCESDLSLAAVNPNENEWFAVAGLGVAPSL